MLGCLLLAITSPISLSALTRSNQNSLTCKKPIQTCKKWIISERKASGQPMSQRLMVITYKTWRSNFFKMQTELSGSASMITNTQEQHYTCPKNSTKWHYARPMTAFSGATTRPTKPTSRSPPPTSGQRCDRTLNDTKTSVYDANREKNRQTRRQEEK